MGQLGRTDYQYLQLCCHNPGCSQGLCVCSIADGPKDGFKYFWITDSCPQTVKEIEGKGPFQILSLAQPIANALQI